MLDVIISWAFANPLSAVGILVAFAIAIGLLMLPRLRAVADHGHPRC
jgi:hypothetical protein